jgi:hypothetical protein
MDAKMIVTEAQRANAYQRAVQNFPMDARNRPQAASHYAETEQHKAASQPAQEPKHPQRSMKHEFLSMLHACSNSGAVKLRDVSRVFDELTGDSTRATR